MARQNPFDNLPPGCSPRDLDRAMGETDLAPDAGPLERWDWLGYNGTPEPFTMDLWEALMVADRKTFKWFIEAYDIQDLWKEANGR